MKSWRKILWSVLTVAVAMLCSCNGGTDVPEPEIPDNQIIAYTASELTAPFATGAFMARIKDNRFTPYASAEGGSGEIIFESPVFMVGALAFRERTTLWTIDLPVDVGAIGKSAFAGCRNLRRVELLGDKITLLGENAFEGCESLEEFVVPDGVREIPIYAFYGCKSLKHITIGSGVVDVYDKAFYGCASLESVEIPQNVTFLGNYCFDGCAQLREVVIRGDRVVDIGSTAFRNCHAELTIRVPSAMLENYRKNELWESYLDRLQPID
ncbi:MAG: leucine-rich repeat domain-containing protein [Tidjanibacter sp.]|nr:leucine-rich repeat domain-containing protein [Tidjanibacter sp.]MBR7129332.1 leucine-rich repeat domain-containing protein [Tidjanibacter sp.]